MGVMLVSDLLKLFVQVSEFFLYKGQMYLKILFG